VLTGTGRRAQLNGYTSAGKTGTAWKFDPKTKRVESSKYVSSFIGFAPYENPAVTIAVVMDEPQVGARDGGMVSAPVFKQIAEAILPELNVAQDGTVQPEDFMAADIPETPGDPAELKKTLSDVPDEAKDKNSSKPAKNAKADGEITDRLKEVPVKKTKDPDRRPGTDKTPAAANPKSSLKNRSSTEKAKQKT
ncbi:MAG: penicillin-binding transpeptidase domain-containing protein, partial [Pyrinomonadaceae bacterium]